MKLKKTLLALGTTLAILGASSSAWANPDYICIKSIPEKEAACVVPEDGWGPWIDNQRVWKGKRIAEVSYYHVRTDCTKECDEKWENCVATWYRSVKKSNNWGYGASWRQGWADTPYSYADCFIVQTDEKPPIGDGNINAPAKKYPEPVYKAPVKKQ